MKQTIKFLLAFGIIIADIILLVISINTNNYDTIGSILTIPLVLLIPFIIKKLFKINVGDGLIIVYLIFIFLAHFLGSCINVYDKISWYDNFTHLLSGIFSCYIAVFILHLFHKDLKKNVVLNIIFIIGIVFTIASGWEFLEFSVDNMLGSDTQHVLDTGVTDTMIDMLYAFGGAIIFNIFYVIEMKHKQNGIIIKSINHLID